MQLQAITQADFKSRFIYNANTQLLGKGGFAEVYEAFDTAHNKTVALKVFSNNIGSKYNITREIQALQQLPLHNNVIQYYEGLEVQMSGTDVHGNTLTQQIAVIEYANYNTLEELMQTTLPEVLRKEIVLGIMKGIQHLHQHGIVHRDIKPRNILLHRENNTITPKITDFGIAKATQDTQATATQTATGIIGTVQYLAPEQIAPEQFGVNGQINKKADVWALGIILYEWVTGKKLYNGSSQTSNVQIIQAVLKGIQKEQLQQLPHPYKFMVEKCLVQKAADRGSIEDIIKGLNKVEVKVVEEKKEEVENRFTILEKTGIGVILFCLLSVLYLIIFKSDNSNSKIIDYSYDSLVDSMAILDSLNAIDSINQFAILDSSNTKKEESFLKITYKEANKMDFNSVTRKISDEDIFNLSFGKNIEKKENNHIIRTAIKNGISQKMLTKIVDRNYLKVDGKIYVSVLLNSLDTKKLSNQDCENCYPELDIAFFEKKKGKYILNQLTENSSLSSGSFGKLFNIKLMEIYGRIIYINEKTSTFFDAYENKYISKYEYDRLKMYEALSKADFSSFQK